MATKKQQQEEKAKKKFARNQQIVGSLRAGWNARQVADEYGLSYSWSKKLCSRLRKGDCGERKPGSGRPRKTTVREDRFLIREAARQRDPSDVCPRTADLSESLTGRTSTQISRRTAQRRLHERNYKKCLKTRKPFVSSVNRRKRLKFAKRYRHWTVDQWKKVVWSDESPYVLRCPNRSHVWRLRKQQFAPRCLQGTLKHQKKIMVWGCFSWKGVGAFHQIKGILTKERYRQILIRQMRPSARRLHGDNFIFQHDNDPKHTAHIVKNYLGNQQIELLFWPPQSPDLNPIENLWAELNRKLNKRTCQSEEQLFECLKQTWENLSDDYLHKLVESMPRRCRKVIKSRGYPIAY